MKITIQNKSMESAPIVIDIPNKKMSKEGLFSKSIENREKIKKRF